MKKKNSLKISCGVLVRLYLSHCVHLNIFQTEEKKKIVILERIQLNKNKAGRLNYKKRLREYKALLY